MNKTRK